MLKKNLFLLFPCILIVFNISAQLETDNKITLTGQADTLRTIKNLAFPVDSADGVSAASIRSNVTSFAEATLAGNTYFLHLTPPVTRYEAGLMITFAPLANSSGNVMINVDGIGDAALYKYTDKPVQANDLVAGGVYEIIYDGANFRLINSFDRACKNGYVEVNENLCIEIYARQPEFFFEAIKTCRDEGGRLCSWSEWAAGCSENISVLGDFGQDREWVNSSSDHNMGSKVVGNNNSCANNWHLNSNLNAAKFRCCHDK